MKQPLIAVCMLALAGCTNLKQEASSKTTTYIGGDTNKVASVTEIRATADLGALAGGKQTVDSLRASAGKTMSVGAKGVTEDANMQWVIDLFKAVADAAAKAAAPVPK